MKKLTMLLLAAALTLCPLFALAAQETISVYNWGDYIEPEVSIRHTRFIGGRASRGSS